MTDRKIERRIFVVGVPRSGTTLVQSLLAAHSAVTSFTETHFFSRHFGIVPSTPLVVLLRDPAGRVREFVVENGFETADVAEVFGGMGRRGGSRLLLPFRTRAVARELVRVLDELALARRVSSWVEKTPRHLRYIPFLESLFADGQSPRFVHVIREGMEAVASLRTASRSWERTYDLATCIERWNRDVDFSLRRAATGRDLFVFYEELTSRPEAVLERLFSDLELEWEPQVLERFRRESSRLVTSDEEWKAGVSHDLYRSATSSHALTEQERVRVDALLRHDLYARLRARAS